MATIINGLTANTDYTQDFNITVIDFTSGIDLSVSNPPASGNGWTFANGIYTVLSGANVTFTGTSAEQQRIEVVQNATASITLNNISITGINTGQSPLLLNI